MAEMTNTTPAAETETAAKKPAAKKATAAKKPAAAKTAAKKAAKPATVSITLKKSLIASKKKQIATAFSLGLKRPGDVTVQPDNAATRGKIAVIRHMVEVH